MSKQVTRPVLHAVQNLLNGVHDLITTIDALVKAHGGKGGAAAAANGRRSSTPEERTEKSAKLRKSIKAHWDAMTPKQRADRVRKMLAGRGLKPKAKK
jgi:hypothetical protein